MLRQFRNVRKTNGLKLVEAEKKEDKIFWRLFWSYIIAIAAPLILIASVTVGVLFSILASDTTDLNVDMIRQVKSIVDMNLQNTVSVPYQLNKSERLNAISNQKFDSTNDMIYHIYEFRRELNTFTLSNKIYNNIAVYFPNNNVVVDRSTFHSLNGFYSRYLEESGCSYEEFEGKLKRKKPFFVESRISENLGEGNILLYCRTADLVSKGEDAPYFFTILNREELVKIAMLSNLSERQSFAMVDSEGAMIIKSSNFNLELDTLNLSAEKSGIIDLRKDVVIYNASDVIPIKYVYAFPKRELAGNVATVTLLFVLLLLISCAVSVWLATINGKKLNGSILSVFSENAVLLESVETQKQLDRHGVLLDMLHNMWWENADPELLTHLHITFEEPALRVLTMAMPNPVGAYVQHDAIDRGLSELNIVVEQMMGELNITCYSLQMENQYFAYILNYREHSVFIKGLTRVVDCLRDRYDILVRIGVGEEVDSAARLSRSYDGAVLALKVETDEEVTFYEEVKSQVNDKVYYTNEKKELLLSSVKQSSVDGVIQILNTIHQTNFQERTLSHSAEKRLIFEMAMTVYRILDENYEGNHEKFEEYDRVCKNLIKNENTQECFDILREIFLSLCTDKKKDNGIVQWRDEVLAYVEQNYSNSELSLNMLAEYFAMNYSYLSRIFKERMGQNFVTYLTIVRLEKAKELLLQTDLTLEQITRQVGFNNQNSFVRIFKKYYSVPPGRFRAEHRN